MDIKTDNSKVIEQANVLSDFVDYVVGRYPNADLNITFIAAEYISEQLLQQATEQETGK